MISVSSHISSHIIQIIKTVNLLEFTEKPNTKKAQASRYALYINQ